MKNGFIKLGILAGSLGLPGVAFAQITGTGDQSFQPGSLERLKDALTPLQPQDPGNLNLFQLAMTVLDFIIIIAAILAIFYLIWAGIRYIMASTDEEAAKKARIGIYNAVIGIVVIVLSYVIIQYVSGLAKQTFDEQITGPSGGVGGLNRQ